MTSPSVQQIPVPILQQAPASPPVYGSPTSQKPGRKTTTASYLNAGTTPQSAQLGNKTLVGA